MTDSRQGGIRPGTTMLIVLIGIAIIGCGAQLLTRPMPDERIVARALEYRIDLNTADEAHLRVLPGVGPAIARRIMAHRREHGPFASLNALRDVSGVGEKTVARLRPLVRQR